MSTPKVVKTSAIQNPSPDNTVMVQRQIKEAVETALRLRGDPNDSYVRVGELTQGGLWTMVNGMLVPGVIANPSIIVADSITGAGTAASPAQLSGDSASPGNSMLYGTNVSGVRGWYTQPAGGSSTLAGLSDVSISSPSNGQVLTFVSSASKWENQTASGGGASNITPDTHPSSPNTMDDEFESGTSINTGKWTAMGLSTGTTAVAQGSLKFSPALLGTRNFGGYSQATPGTAFTVTAKLVQVNPTTNTLSGLFFATASAAAGKIVVFAWNVTTLVVQRLTNNTTFSANQLLSTSQIVAQGIGQFPWTYLQLNYDGTNLNCLASLSGLSGTFVQIYTETAAAFLGGAPALCGIGVDNESATIQSVLAVDWFRRTA